VSGDDRRGRGHGHDPDPDPDPDPDLGPGPGPGPGRVAHHLSVVVQHCFLQEMVSASLWAEPF
jgi:hypothetical protein